MNPTAYLYPFFCGVGVAMIGVKVWKKINEFKYFEIERVLEIRE